MKLHHIWPERPTKQLISSGQRGMTGTLPMLLLCCLTSVSTAASFRAESLVFQQYGELWERSPGSPGTPGSTSLPLLLQTGHGRRGTRTLNTCSDYFFKRNYSKVADNLNSCWDYFGFSFVLRDIMPGRIMKSEIICTPTRLGERKIVAKLISNQIKGISTEKGIIITE